MSRELRGIFVVGTDTGVGKTFVARALCRAVRRRGRPVVGLKPYETGCNPRAADAEALEREARSGLPIELRCPFRYRTPVAPAVAAQQERRRHPIGAAIEIVREAARGKYAIVESAGGLASPLNGDETNLDLARRLGLPTLLVARDVLGTLSHISLALEALRRRQVPILGLVLSQSSFSRDPSRATNLAWAQRLSGLPQVILLPPLSVGRAAIRLAPLLPFRS